MSVLLVSLDRCCWVGGGVWSNEPDLVAAINATLHPDLTLVVVCDPPGPVVAPGGRGFASQPPNSVAALAFRARVRVCAWMEGCPWRSQVVFLRKCWSMCACL